ncbi:acyl-CoA thioesterase [Desulfovibrio inopinatus]|uniref:acyl-CoA thioesterase n=1 Tax=Desulfovibrio inopinatus TaxID=102109 RepID=UPI0003FCA7DE|nr:thioesterase family protein [Desulfovibrio inopinatus]
MADFPVVDSWYRHFVSYGETDCMGVVYYGEYAHLFERARSQLVRERGISYREVEERGIFLPIRELATRYIKPIRYDDAIVVHAGIEQWGRASVTFVYEIFGPPEEQTLICTGKTMHACVNGDGKPVRVPDWLKDYFKP